MKAEDDCRSAVEKVAAGSRAVLSLIFELPKPELVFEGYRAFSRDYSRALYPSLALPRAT
jgi:hypothetical protein